MGTPRIAPPKPTTTTEGNIPAWLRDFIAAAKPPAEFAGHVEFYVSPDGISSVTIKQSWSRTAGAS
jgi:hypothetical protein